MPSAAQLSARISHFNYLLPESTRYLKPQHCCTRNYTRLLLQGRYQGLNRLNLFKMADSSSLKPMWLVEPIAQVSEALRIVDDVSKTSNKFLMNKHQCNSLANRLVHAIGETLKGLPKESVCSAGNKMDYPAFDLLLTVLKKAQALLSKYTESKESISSVLTRTEDREAFEEVHAEIDMLNSQFHFGDFEYTSESTRTAMLTGAADEDKNELSESLHVLVHSEDLCRQAAQGDSTLEKMKLVVSEKSERTDGLPSYLNIDPASVEILGEVRIPQRLSEHDPVATDGWACVRFGRYLGCAFALKVFNSGNATWNRGELLKEVRSLMELHNPHIVQLMGFAQDAEKCIILMELMDTDLRHYMKSQTLHGGRPFTRAVEMDIITQIARGLYYLHEQQYVHGELKCSNILVKRIGDHVDVKISDLRSSKNLGVWDPVLFKERSTRSRPRWTAPEVVHYGELEPTHELLKKTDVYSFGMVCYEVFTGKLPFQDVRDDALKERIQTGDLKQPLPGELHAQLRRLIESCWSRNPEERPTLETICHLLNDIRSSQPPVTVISSGIDTVLRRLKMIPAILRHFRGAERDGNPPTARGEAKVGEYGDSAGAGESALTLPEFVRIAPAKLKRERLLGRGASAEVHQATWLGLKYAVKTFSSTSPPSEVQAELKFLIELRHPCIVRLMGLSVHSERRCSIVMEFMGGDLRQLIDSRMRKRRREAGGVPVDVVPFDLPEAVYIITRVALGMMFLHSRGVVHRDLKALNVLVPEHPGSIDVKITDFGVSQLIGDPSGRPSVGVGTRFWRAPEMLAPPSAALREVAAEAQPMADADGDAPKAVIDLMAADVYSFAMTCYEVLTGGVPLADEVNALGTAAVKSAVLAGELRPTWPCGRNPGLTRLVEDCWAARPEERPTFFSICTRLQTIKDGLHSSTSERAQS